MPSLALFVSNRLELLSEKLAEVLKTPLSSPLKKEIIVVQSKGMERWVSMELAYHHGIWANCWFPFPNAILHALFQAVIPDLSEDSPFEPEVMTWKIMKLLPRYVDKSEFETIRNYLGDEGGDLKRFQLSERIAFIFDQYLVFRPEMLLAWEKGKEDHWQAVLWRILVNEAERPHRASIREAFLNKIRQSSINIHGFPERLSVFGISALPRFHLEVLSALSRFIPVNVFLMNPCQEYWGTIVSDREAKKITRRYSKKSSLPEALYLETGNRLLASLGMLGRDFFELVYGLEAAEHDFFEGPDEGTMLSAIQSDILNLRERGGGDKKTMVGKTDRSLQFHSCHSPMREIEVLYDNFLAMFEEAPELMPKDILIMTPDIEAYAPFIQAVFDTPVHESLRIPYSIADRSITGESHTFTVFMAILDLCGSRFGASQVLTILDSKPVQSKFGLSEAEVDLIKRWVEHTGIRWGIDQETRTQMDLPEFAENTWKFGLDRLLLGYTMPGGEEKLFQGILPYDNMEGDETQVLGNLLAFTEQLFSAVTSLDQPRSLTEWAGVLTGVLERFFLSDEEHEREIGVIRRTLNDLVGKQELSGFNEKIGLTVIKSYLRHRYEKEGFGFGFLAGGVTFCTMLPMRSIPFKVIGLIGMNNDAYPRQSKPLSFDLLAQHPQLGDPSRRNDDRYLFLEALLSARKKLYVSYVGQSIQDNSVIPPSVVVSELLDYIEMGFTTSGAAILDQAVAKHRLQAFSPEYFKKSEKLFSYSEDNCQAARFSLEARKAPMPFIAQGLSEPGTEWRTVDVDALCRFFANPARFLLNQRLGIYLEERGAVISDKEVFDLEGLEKYELEQLLLEKSLLGYDLRKFFPVIKASGKLPPGTVGECLYERWRANVEDFTALVREHVAGKTLTPLDIDLRVSGFQITGRIGTLFIEGLVHYRYAKIKPKDLLKLWLQHLILTSRGADDYSKTSMLIGLNQKGAESVWRYGPVGNSKETLKRFLEYYWEGLSQPLHFFPDSSWEYARLVLAKGRTEDQAISSARETWNGTEYNRGEGEDPYYQLCFGKIDPLDSAFKRIAKEIFELLLRYGQIQ
ncbi:MAG: exodeoxyribonuclease V subunit gamma [Pseudomonadota bacterium]